MKYLCPCQKPVKAEGNSFLMNLYFVNLKFYPIILCNMLYFLHLNDIREAVSELSHKKGG